MKTINIGSGLHKKVELRNGTVIGNFVPYIIEYCSYRKWQVASSNANATLLIKRHFSQFKKKMIAPATHHHHHLERHGPFGSLLSQSLCAILYHACMCYFQEVIKIK
jgi:hypothetical protein